MDKPEPPSPGSAPVPRPLMTYTAAGLNEVADRCDERKATGFIVTPGSVRLFAAGLRALVRERKNG